MGGSPWGGSEALWHAVALHALKQGDEVFVSIYDWGKVHDKIAQLQAAGAVVYHRKKFNASAGLIEKISRFVAHRVPAANKDYQSIIDFKPEAIFISQGDSFDLAIHHRPLYKLIAKNAIPYFLVCHTHQQYSWVPDTAVFPGAVEIFSNAKRVYFISKRQWQITERRLVAKIINGQFTWNPLNMELPEQPLDWPDETIIQMAIVGALEGNKGQDTALEVLSQPAWTLRNWQLNFYGNGEGKIYLQSLADFYGIGHKLVFHGHVNDIKAVWQTNHILLVPSAGEGMPINLVEAMACGRPSVVTDVGGNTELITEDETGFIAASPSTASFSTALEKAWENKAGWRQMGRHAFDKTKQCLDKNPEIAVHESLKNG